MVEKSSSETPLCVFTDSEIQSKLSPISFFGNPLDILMGSCILVNPPSENHEAFPRILAPEELHHLLLATVC